MGYIFNALVLATLPMVMVSKRKGKRFWKTKSGTLIFFGPRHLLVFYCVGVDRGEKLSKGHSP